MAVGVVEQGAPGGAELLGCGDGGGDGDDNNRMYILDWFNPEDPSTPGGKNTESKVRVTKEKFLEKLEAEAEADDYTPQEHMQTSSPTVA